MDAATLQNRIYKGYAKAALRIGYLTDQYRPSSATNPLVVGNKINSFNASFNAEDMKYGKPNKYGHPTWFGLYDGSLTQVGDYLKNAHDGTFFIAAQQTNLPILLVQCNRSVQIGRMPALNSAGYKGYSGVVNNGKTDVLGTSDAKGNFVSGWPASILIAGKSDKDPILPSSVKLSGVTILLPVSVPIQIRESDVIQDDIGNEYSIYSVELTDLGWRLQANNEHA